MKIFFDHQVFSFQRYGGISRYFYELISGLCKREGANVSLFLGWTINEYGIKALSDSSLACTGWKYPFRNYYWLPLKDINTLLLRCYFPRLTIDDIYHQTYYDDNVNNHRTKKVITVHDMIHEKCSQLFPFYDLTKSKKKTMVAKADGIICVSESTKKDLIEYHNVPENKIVIIYHGNSLNNVVITSPPINGNPYILYVGSRNRYKNFDLLLDAYLVSPIIRNNYKLICFGGGPFNRKERRLLATLRVDNQILYYDGNDSILANLYKYAAVLVFPSLYEGFGFPPLEAMHFGCPVLVSNSSSIPEVVGHAGLYFDPHSKDDLIQKLELILTDSSLRQKNVKLGFEQGKKFTWDKCVSETLDFYASISSR